ncbi:MAG: Stealth CR1 domain-containing protein [Bacteroidetes bacterium]|nr:Stealth CR1 domain-containing protein [Bacteroidota bacterium]MCH8523130.1 Stealth CR1 domain-containing protein [Balneolales bacterium]
MKSETHSIPEVDVVITWVDGNDPEHKRKRKKLLGRPDDLSETLLSTAGEKTRFIDNGEIRYTIGSIRKFAPWIRTIFVVTDAQKPDFFTDAYMKSNRIQLIDHSEIFSGFEWSLPTFNSRSIETVLWRIRDLADRFIFFNDDFLLTAPVRYEDFFRDNDVVLRGNWSRILPHGRFYMNVNALMNSLALKWFGITRSLHLLYQIRSAQLAGLKHKYFRIPHIPHPVKKETLVHFFKKNESLLSENLKYPLRDTAQFSSFFLANHIEIMKGTAVLKGTKEVLMLNGETDYGFYYSWKMNTLKKGKKRFLCIQAIDKFSEAKKTEIYGYLDNLLDLHSTD